MPDLTITLKRHPDGSASLACTRPDGTTTWQRQTGQLAHFFPQHDLTHYAVETTLGFRRGFYGLIADGWDIGDFAAPWPRGPMPPEGGQVELIVGFFDAERAAGAPMTAAEFREHAARFIAAREAKRPGVEIAAPRALSDEELQRVRARRAELLARWFAVREGDALELEFQRGEAS